MKYIIILFLSFIVSNFALSQDSSLINLNSDGFLVNLQSRNFTNNSSNYSSYFDGKQTSIELLINATAWKFSPNFNFAAMVQMTGDYNYRNNGNLGYYKSRNFSSAIFGETDYYLKNKVYITGSATTEYYNGSIESIINPSPELSRKDYYKNGVNYIWFGLGYGRIVNTASITKEVNFERILKEQKIIFSNLPALVKKELDILIEKRNNKDFISKYHDDSDAEFFAEVEKILQDNGVINKPLGAETTIKLYNSLNNERYLYYPNYRGFQLQTEAQIQLNDNRFDQFLTTGGIYGIHSSDKMDFLFSGFFSLPLNIHSNSGGLFYNRYKTPFDNYLPVLVEKYKIANTNFLKSREYLTYFGEDLSYVTGTKAILFYKFNEYSGIRGYTSIVVTKPDTLSASNASSIGAILDYNIFSHLTLNFQAEYDITSRAKPFFYYNLGFLWNIF